MYNLINRAHQQFGDKGLDIVVVTKLNGHCRYQITEGKEHELQWKVFQLGNPLSNVATVISGSRAGGESNWRRAPGLIDASIG